VSYILDALRKAERERQVATVPTLATVHQPAKAAPHRLWPWIVGAVVVANAAALAWLMGSTRTPDLSIPPGLESARSAPAVTTRPPAASPRLEADIRPPTATAVVAEAEHRPPVGPDARPGPRPTDSARAESRAPAAAPSEPAAPARSRETPPSRAASAVPPRVSSPAPRVSAVEKSVGAPSAVASEILARMHLQAIVYSETPSARLVFINNHKFVEGQSIDGTVTVQRIMPDGVVLNSGGERIVLRAGGEVRP
jgi:general secretion pathway protein B